MKTSKKRDNVRVYSAADSKKKNKLGKKWSLFKTKVGSKKRTTGTKKLKSVNKARQVEPHGSLENCWKAKKSDCLKKQERYNLFLERIDDEVNKFEKDFSSCRKGVKVKIPKALSIFLGNKMELTKKNESTKNQEIIGNLRKDVEVLRERIRIVNLQERNMLDGIDYFVAFLEKNGNRSELEKLNLEESLKDIISSFGKTSLYKDYEAWSHWCESKSYNNELNQLLEKSPVEDRENLLIGLEGYQTKYNDMDDFYRNDPREYVLSNNHTVGYSKLTSNQILKDTALEDFFIDTKNKAYIDVLRKVFTSNSPTNAPALMSHIRDLIDNFKEWWNGSGKESYKSHFSYLQKSIEDLEDIKNPNALYVPLNFHQNK